MCKLSHCLGCVFIFNLQLQCLSLSLFLSVFILLQSKSKHNTNLATIFPRKTAVNVELKVCLFKAIFSPFAVSYVYIYPFMIFQRVDLIYFTFVTSLAGSVSKIKVQTRKNILMVKISSITSGYFWKCEACGWTSPPPPNASTSKTQSQPSLTTSNPTSNSNPNAFGTLGKEDSSPATEMNYMYRTAESWYRPPSFVTDLPSKMPALRLESPDSETATQTRPPT
ncbi:hypothetical protein J3R30DRAFT_3506667 [Lentinula aciculospora]|uniref:Uncharacterized protein n=1 Tax=Lentinula aciculospora TaxID=153920 RepID=A0A9W9A4R0_9AGAR|nr:hypothetical protein J3R30DRAFT_3506667 [Lentinula aciculospora]